MPLDIQITESNHNSRTQVHILLTPSIVLKACTQTLRPPPKKSARGNSGRL